MNQDKKNHVDSRQRSAFRRIEKMHPIKMLLYLSMIGIGVLFFILTVAFIRTGGFPSQDFVLPRFFSVSTIVLLFSSFTISKVPRYYKREKLKKMARYLGFTLALGLLFIAAQLIGWNEMSRTGIHFTGKASGTYLYLISALHMLHLVGGIIFLSFMVFKTIYVKSDGVRSLIFIRDPFRHLQLSMLTSYWHFMDFLWLALYIVFLFIA